MNHPGEQVTHPGACHVIAERGTRKHLHLLPGLRALPHAQVPPGDPLPQPSLRTGHCLHQGVTHAVRKFQGRSEQAVLVAEVVRQQRDVHASPLRDRPQRRPPETSRRELLARRGQDHSPVVTTSDRPSCALAHSAHERTLPRNHHLLTSSFDEVMIGGDPGSGAVAPPRN